MGLTDEQARRRQAQLTPPKQDAPEEKTLEVDRSGFMDPDVMRGFPMMDGKHGLPGGGAIKDSKPGGEIGAAKRMERQMQQEARDLNGKAREIVRSQLQRTRRKDHRDDRTNP